MPTRRERTVREQGLARAKHRRNLILSMVVLAALVVVVTIIVTSGVLTPSQSVVAQAPAATATCSAIQSFPTQSQEHIKPNEPHPAYSSNPPTSGWHWDTPQDWGIYTGPQVQEQIVHNLEHGGIIIQYNGLNLTDVQRLTDLVKGDSHHMILAPYPGLPSGTNLALTAWDHLQTCSGVDEAAIKAFVNGFRDKGPELVP